MSDDPLADWEMEYARAEFDRRRAVQLRDALRIHHPIMRSETGPFSGCRCGQVQLGQDVIAHVVEHLRAALDGGALR